MRLARLRETDPTWLVVAGVGILALAALISMLVVRSAQTPTDLSSPGGVVTAYVQAVQAGKADQAWTLLSPDAIRTGPGGFGPYMSKSDFQQQVEGNRHTSASRVRILGTTQSGDSATVQVEVTNGSADLISAASSQTVVVSLKREAAGWRITSNPYPWQFE